jgi:hypothetical protein
VENDEDSRRTSRVDSTTNDEFSELHQSESILSKKFLATHLRKSNER